MDALKRRADLRLNDRSLDPKSRAILRYALETHDPWLAKLVRYADEEDTLDFLETPTIYGDNLSHDRIEALADLICRDGDETEMKSVALLLLMNTIEYAKHPKTLANVARTVR